MRALPVPLSRACSEVLTMKVRALAVLTSALLSSTPALAQNTDEPVKSAQVDLNGDGKPEAISIDSGANGAFTLKVGAATLKGNASGNEVSGFSLVDLDSGDKWKEVLVHTIGDTDDLHRFFLFGYDGKSVKPLGDVRALSEAKGNGIVLVDSWMGFWNRRDKFTLDRKAWRLVPVKQELYYVGAEATVKQSFPLARSRTDAAVIANVAPNSKILVLAAAVPDNDPEHVWYLVKSSTGLLGWTRFPALGEKTEGLPFAG